MNARRNVEGYTDASGFHPIRASKDYNEFLAGDFESGKQQTKKQTRERREWEDKELREARESSGAPRKTLAQFVRAMGGIVPGGMFAGEIQRLGYHETGTTGLLNQHARQGNHKQTAEYVMDAANVEGYTDRRGERFTRIGDFIAAVETSAVKGIDHYRQRGATAKQRRAKQMARATRQNPIGYAVEWWKWPDKSRAGRAFFDNREAAFKFADKKSDSAALVAIYKSDGKGHWKLIAGQKPNPGMFGPETKAAAKQVERIRPVKDRATGERGHVIGAGPQGWLKVQWANRAKPTLIRRSELKLARGRQGNPSQPTENQKAWRKGYEHGFKGMNSRPDYPLVGLAGSYRLGYEAGYKRRKEPKGPRKKSRQNSSATEFKPGDRVRLSNNVRHAEYRGLDGTVRRVIKSRNVIEVQVTDRRGHKQLYDAAPQNVVKLASNPKAKGSRDALGVWHKENPAGRKARYYVSPAPTIRGWYVKRVNVEVDGTESDGGVFGKYNTKRDAQTDAKRLNDRLKKHGLYQSITGKANPSVTALSETFQGEADGSTEKSYAASSAPANLARAGNLVFLKVSGKSFRIPGATVAIAPNEKLWIVGDHAPLFETKAKPGEGLDVGEVTHICYETAKAHIGGGKTYEYVHEFGEDGGKRPHLIIDHDGMPVLRGGDYKIKAEGIVN